MVMATLLLATISTAGATVPTPAEWTGKGAMAHWSYVDGTDVITIDAVVAQQEIDSLGNPITSHQNMIYISVTHSSRNGGNPSEVTGYKEFTTWSMDSASITATLDFPWSGSSRSHTVKIDWIKTTDSPTTGYFVKQNGEIQYTVGEWQKCTAKITIDNKAGPHPTPIDSDWAVIGQQPAILTSNGLQPTIITSSDSTGAIKSTFSMGEDIYAKGSGYAAGTYNVYVVKDTTWTDGLEIPVTSIVMINSITVGSSGNILNTLVYPSAALGYYDIVVDVNGNGHYDPATDGLCDNVVASGGFFVVPEYALGGALLALVSCFAAFAVIRRRDTHPKVVTP
jgi:hypothetical protein